MLNLFILNETLTNGFSYFFINVISLLSIVCGILVIVSKNPIVSVLFLIGLFLTIAGYLMMLGINFIGLSYLLVYVGAISILFLFILMLINIRVSELVTDTSNSIPLAIFIGIFFNITLYRVLPSYQPPVGYNNYVTGFKFNDVFTDNYLKNIYNNYDSNEIVFVTSQLWDGALSETTHITTLGNIMYTSYLMWLMITSVILLLAMVGAIVITIKQQD